MFNPFRNRTRWILIGWMFVISAIAYLDRVNIAIAGHSIQEEFHLDNIQLGWVFSAFVAGYATAPNTSTNTPLLGVDTLEHGGFGAAAASPAARHILSQWFYGRRGPFKAGTSKTL